MSGEFPNCKHNFGLWYKYTGVTTDETGVSVLRKRVKVEKPNEYWIENANLYALSLTAPGKGKTPAGCKPIHHSILCRNLSINCYVCKDIFNHVNFLYKREHIPIWRKGPRPLAPRPQAVPLGLWSQRHREPRHSRCPSRERVSEMLKLSIVNDRITGPKYLNHCPIVVFFIDLLARERRIRGGDWTWENALTRVTLGLAYGWKRRFRGALWVLSWDFEDWEKDIVKSRDDGLVF